MFLICTICKKTEKIRPSGRNIMLTLQTGFESAYPFGLAVFRTAAPPAERLQPKNINEAWKIRTSGSFRISGLAIRCNRPLCQRFLALPKRFELLTPRFVAVRSVHWATEVCCTYIIQLSRQGWIRTNDVSSVADLQSAAFAARLPVVNGTDRNRTCDAWIFSPSLYHLSYRPIFIKKPVLRSGHPFLHSRDQTEW